MMRLARLMARVCGRHGVPGLPGPAERSRAASAPRGPAGLSTPGRRAEATEVGVRAGPAPLFKTIPRSRLELLQTRMADMAAGVNGRDAEDLGFEAAEQHRAFVLRYV